MINNYETAIGILQNVLKNIEKMNSLKIDLDEKIKTIYADGERSQAYKQAKAAEIRSDSMEAISVLADDTELLISRFVAADAKAKGESDFRNHDLQAAISTLQAFGSSLPDDMAADIVQKLRGDSFSLKAIRVLFDLSHLSTGVALVDRAMSISDIPAWAQRISDTVCYSAGADAPTSTAPVEKLLAEYKATFGN